MLRIQEANVPLLGDISNQEEHVQAMGVGHCIFGKRMPWEAKAKKPKHNRDAKRSNHCLSPIEMEL